MNIYITLDYELFFGDSSGDIHSCLLEPTNQLLKICNDYNVKLCFFVDVGYLLALKRCGKQHQKLLNNYELIVAQLRDLSSNNHDIQLHIHPHWEDSFYDGHRWVFDFSRYRLVDFEQTEISRIVKEYKEELENIAKRPVFVHRAGGWCLQPFEKLANSLYQNGIFVDSTVFLNGYNHSSTHFFDFRNSPDDITIWKFEKDPLCKSVSGSFVELPIASLRVSPVFFWLMAWNKLFGDKNLHGTWGKGRPIKNSKKQLFRLLTRVTNSVVSIDGFKASYLDKAFVLYLKKFKDNIQNEHFVIIGHPKSISNYSLLKLESFIKLRKDQHRFTTYFNELGEIKNLVDV